MTRWEYASLVHEAPASKAVLDELGAEGWELVSLVQGSQTGQMLYVFKRPVPVPDAGTEAAKGGSHDGS